MCWKTTYRMSYHPNEIELAERLSWIFIEKQYTDPASLCFDGLWRYSSTSPLLKIIPIHSDGMSGICDNSPGR